MNENPDQHSDWLTTSDDPTETDAPSISSPFSAIPEPQEEPDDTRSLAWRVIKGEFGRGEERREALGDRYDDVIAEVVKMRLSGGRLV